MKQTTLARSVLYLLFSLSLILEAACKGNSSSSSDDTESNVNLASAVTNTRRPASIPILGFISSPRRNPTPDINALADRVQKIMIAKCANCHNAQTPSGNVGNLFSAQAILEKGLVVKNSAVNSKLYQVVASNQMPVGVPLNDASKKDIADWIDLGAAEFPVNLPQATPIPQPVLNLVADEETIYQDLQKIAVDTQPFIRYIVTTQNYNSSGLLTAQKVLFPQGVSKTLNSLHWKSTISNPVALNRESTALRIDLRDYDLSATEWTRITESYPYRIQLQISNRWSALAAATKSDAPVVRGDWFVQQVLQPVLYKQLLEIPDNIQTLETRLGVSAEARIRDGSVIRAGFKDSGVSFSNRVIERYESSFGPYWKSYDFVSSQGKQDIFSNPLGPVLDNFSQNIGFIHNGGEMIFTLPNGLHGYVLTNAAGDYLNTAPPTIVSDPSRADKLVSNGNSCFTCHTLGWIPVQDEVRVAANNNSLFNASQHTAINRLYASNLKIEDTFKKDVAAYVAALDKLQISFESGEPVSTVNLYYARNLQIKDIAAELQLSVAELNKYLESSVSLRGQLEFFDSQQVTSVNISRVHFEQRFNQILQEIAKLIPPDPSTNLALSRPVTVSSTQPSDSRGSYSAGYAVDGNSASRWSSTFADPQWIAIDLGSRKQINRVMLNWETAYGKAYSIQVSDDNAMWTTIYSTTTGDGGVDDLTYLFGAGRYIRMYGTARGTQWGYSLYDMSVYGN